MTLTRLKLGQIDLKRLRELRTGPQPTPLAMLFLTFQLLGHTSNTLMGVVNGNVSVAVDTLPR